MDWLARIDWPMSMAVSVIATGIVNGVIWAFHKARSISAYEEGFDDGLRSELRRLAKMKYGKDVGVCLCVVPQEEYEKELGR